MTVMSGGAEAACVLRAEYTVGLNGNGFNQSVDEGFQEGSGGQLQRELPLSGPQPICACAEVAGPRGAIVRTCPPSSPAIPTLPEFPEQTGALKYGFT